MPGMLHARVLQHQDTPGDSGTAMPKVCAPASLLACLGCMNAVLLVAETICCLSGVSGYPTNGRAIIGHLTAELPSLAACTEDVYVCLAGWGCECTWLPPWSTVQVGIRVTGEANDRVMYWPDLRAAQPGEGPCAQSSMHHIKVGAHTGTVSAHTHGTSTA